MAKKAKAQTGAPSGTEKDPGATPPAPGAPPIGSTDTAPGPLGASPSEATMTGAPVVAPPAAPEPVQAKGPKRLKISNPACAGLKIGGSTGAIVFDENGVAEVGVEDHAHFLKVPGYVSVE